MVFWQLTIDANDPALLARFSASRFSLGIVSSISIFLPPALH